MIDHADGSRPERDEKTVQKLISSEIVAAITKKPQA